MHGDAVDDEVGALVVGLGPEGRVLQRNVLDCDIVALTEIDELWAVGHAAQLERVVDDAVARLSQEVVGERAALSLDYSLAGDGYVVLLVGEDESVPRVELHVVVVGIGRPHEYGAFAEMQGDVGPHVDAACEVAAYGEYESATALLCDIVYRLLDGAGVHGGSVALDAEEGHLVVFGGDVGGGDGHQRCQYQMSYLAHSFMLLGSRLITGLCKTVFDSHLSTLLGLIERHGGVGETQGHGCDLDIVAVVKLQWRAGIVL